MLFVAYILFALVVAAVLSLIVVGIGKFVKNNARTIVACFLVVVVFIAGFMFLPPAKAEVDVYSKAAVVVDIKLEQFDTAAEVTVEDGEGNLWIFYWDFAEDEDLELGDVVAMMMWDCGTPDYIFDDEVLDIINEHFKAQ